MVAIDTNVLLRYYTNDVPALGRQAQDIIDQAAPNSLFLDRLILAEMVYVLKSFYKFTKPVLVEILQSLLHDRRFVINEIDIVRETVKLFGEEKPLSFEDCWLLALMRQQKVTSVVTFDQQLNKRL